MAVRMYVERGPLSFDGTTLRLQVYITIPEVNSVGEGVDFTGLPANVASAAALLTAMRNRAITFALNQHNLTIAAADVVIFGGPQ